MDERVVTLYLSGMSLNKVGRIVGVTGPTVKAWLKMYDISIRCNRPTQERWNDIVKLYKKGASLNSLAKKINTTGPTLKAWLKKDGVRINYERPVYSKEIKDEAKRLYIEEELSAAKVAKIMGLKTFTVKEWISHDGIIRSMSEAASLSIAKGGHRARTASATWYTSKKTGKKVFADSSLEYLRMVQLDNDNNVVTWSRCNLRIKYISPHGKVRHYNPDLFVKYKNGDIVIEEVKPKSLLTEDVNLAKFKACRELCCKKGYSFTLITEEHVGKSRGLDCLKLGRREYLDLINERRRVAKLNETAEQKKIRLAKNAAYMKKYMARRRTNWQF